MAAVVATADILPDVEKNSLPVWYPISFFTENDIDPAGGGLTLTIVPGSDTNCTAVIDATGEYIVVTPDYDFTGQIFFLYRATDIEDDFAFGSVTGDVITDEYIPEVEIRNAENQEWLSKDNHKIILVDVAYHDGITQNVKYFSLYPYVMTYNEVDYVNIIGESVGNVGYDDVILSTPILSSQIDSSTNAGLIELLNVNGEYDYLLDYAWEGHPIGIYIGEPSWARGRFIQIFEGVVESFTSPNNDSLAISMIDKAEILEVSIQDKLINTDDDYLGTLYDSSPTQPAFSGLDYGGRTVPDTTIDKPVPVCLGKCYNIEPVLIDSSNHVYQIHDGPIESVDAVRANGIVLTEGASGYYVNLDIGCIKLNVTPTNALITCDVVGVKNRSANAQSPPLSGGYPYAVVRDSAAFIVEWLLLEKTSITIDDIDSESFSKLGADGFDTICGIYITEETTVASATTEIMQSISGFIRFSRSPTKVQLLRVIDPAGKTASSILKRDNIIERGMSLVAVEKPKKSINLGYEKNWHVLDKDSLAGAIIDDPPNPEYDADIYNRLTTEFLTSVTDTSITNLSDQYPLIQESEIIETLISDNVTPNFWADTESARRMGLREIKRFVYRIEATATPFEIVVGDIVYITHHRYGFENGRHAFVIGLDEDPINKKVTLEVWV